MIDDIRPITSRNQRPIRPETRQEMNNNLSQHTTVSTSVNIPKPVKKRLLKSVLLARLWAALSLRIKTPVRSLYRTINMALEWLGLGLSTFILNVLTKNHRLRKGIYRYGVMEVRRESVLGVKTSFIIMLAIILLPLAQFAPVLAATDTQTLVPNGDNANGTNNWPQNSGTSDNSCTGGVDCDFVDEDGETDYLGTGTGMDGVIAEQEFDMTDLVPLGSFNHVSQVNVTINAGINGSCQGNGTNCDSLQVRLFINGGYNGTTNTATLTTSPSDHTFNWAGLTQGAHSDIRLEIIRVENGTGPASGRDDDVRMYDVRANVTYDYTITSNVQQTHFRWRDDSTALDTDGGWLAAEDSNSIGDINQLQTYRLRVEAANVSSTTAANAYQYRLEYAVKSGTCGASSGWARITTSSDAFEMVDTTHYTNQEQLDNSRLTASETTFVAGDAMDTTDESASVSLAVDEYTELEYSIRATADATEGESYCFRLTNAGTILNSYPVFPEVTLSTPPPVPYLSQEGYVFENDDGVPQSLTRETFNAFKSNITHGTGSFTTSSFTPASNSLLVVSVGAMIDNASGTVAGGSGCLTISDSASLTWTSRVFVNQTDAYGLGLQVWTAPVTTAASMTITVDCGATNMYSYQLQAISYTGYDTNNPIGATGTDSDTEIGANSFNLSAVPALSSEVYANIYATNFPDITTVAPGASWTELNDEGLSNGWSIMQGQVRSGSTSQSVDWSDVADTNEADRIKNIYVGLEIKAGSGQNENSTQQAGSEFSIGKTLSQVRQGERINLRTHITNTGGMLDTDDELALFYDRGDGVWSKVPFQQPAETTTGTCDQDTDWDCTLIENSGHKGSYSSMAIAPDGTPWIAHHQNATSTCDDSPASECSLQVAHYVGTGGTGCSGNTAWSCEVIDNPSGSGNNVGVYSSLAFDSSGVAWISYADSTNDVLKVARYVGTGGTGCSGNTAWSCEAVDSFTASFTGMDPSIAIDSSNNPVISYYDADNTALKVAIRDGSSTCDADADWSCETVDNSGSDTIGEESSVAVDGDGVIWVSYYDGGTETALKVASRDGGGGGSCTDNDWNCEIADNTGTDTGDYTSVAISPDNIPWVAYYDTTNTALRVAVRDGGGSGSCTDNDWNCAAADSTGDIGEQPSIAFAPDGNAWITYYDNDATLDNKALKYTRYIGSGGSGCASGAWDGCGKIDSTSTDAVGRYSSIAFDSSGTAWISYHNASLTDLQVANLKRAGEITIVPSVFSAGGAMLGESHVDMTSSTDTAGRDDADCINGSANWNNGIYFGAANGSGLAFPGGDSTAQCTEIVWTLDTSQAVPGTTYRFIVATKDAFRPDKGPWRGPVAVAADGYPTLAIRSDDETTYRYSKDVLAKMTDCSASGWGCTNLTNSDKGAGASSSIAVAPDGTMWITTYENALSDRDLFVAKYVGSGGTGCASSAWDCEDIEADANQRGTTSTIAFAPDGTPWISFTDSGGIALYVAKYVGSGGSCTNTKWECTTVDIPASTNTGDGVVMEFDNTGNPWLAYTDQTNDDLKIARYVGSGGTGCNSSAWTCEKIADVTDITSSRLGMVIDDAGKVRVSYTEEGVENDIWVAEYVGSSGTGCANPAWTCTQIDSSVNGSSDLIIDGTGTVWLAYEGLSGGGVTLARYVGTGGSGCDLIAWTCEAVKSSTGGVAGPRLAVDSVGNPWISYIDNNKLAVARYVGTGGSGCTSAAWVCVDVDSTNINVGNSDISFDASGTPWVTYGMLTDELGVAKMHLPPGKLSNSFPSSYNSRSAGSGDLRYHLSSGLAPYTESYGTCGGNGDLYGYCGLFHPDGQMDSITAGDNERPIYGFSQRYDDNNTVPAARINFRTSVSPATQNVVLQVYRHGSTNAWETVDTYDTAGCGTSNCVIAFEPTGVTSEYFEADGSNYWLHYRLYQEESSSGSTTLYIDGFGAPQTKQQLRHGRIFRDSITDPIRW